jgi:hypothetical protein
MIKGVRFSLHRITAPPDLVATPIREQQLLSNNRGPRLRTGGEYPILRTDPSFQIYYLATPRPGGRSPTINHALGVNAVLTGEGLFTTTS